VTCRVPSRASLGTRRIPSRARKRRFAALHKRSVAVRERTTKSEDARSSSPFSRAGIFRGAGRKCCGATISRTICRAPVRPRARRYDARRLILTRLGSGSGRRRRRPRDALRGGSGRGISQPTASGSGRSPAALDVRRRRRRNGSRGVVSCGISVRTNRRGRDLTRAARDRQRQSYEGAFAAPALRRHTARSRRRTPLSFSARRLGRVLVQSVRWRSARRHARSVSRAA
jgi:hypothetical protein